MTVDAGGPRSELDVAGELPAPDDGYDRWFDDPEFDHPEFDDELEFDDDDYWELDLEVDDPEWTSTTSSATSAGADGFSAGSVLVKIVLVFGVGVAVWAVVALVSPTTVVDTTDLSDEATTLVGIGGDGQVLNDGVVTDGVVTPAPLQVEGGSVVVGGGGDPEQAELDPDSDGALGDSDGDGLSDDGSAAAGSAGLDYQSNLALLQGASVRNTNHDNSPYLNTPSDALVLEDLYGPRSDYLSRPAGNPENAFPISAGGQFRAGCEFSHFSYDDPLVFPGKPGASHLHMHFGNTHVNAFSTYDTLINSGSSTCNGQELNRTGYWVPAMFDGAGNVRIPERIVVYYKGEGRARGSAEVYPEGAAMIADYNLNTMPTSEGGIGGKKLTFQCSDNFSTVTGVGSQTMAACDGSRFGSAEGGRWVVLEMSVKFPQCWNGQDPSNWDNFQPPQGDWYVSDCGGAFSHTMPNLEYFVNYKVDIGENTADWFLSSDIDPTSFGASKATGGSTSHGDWWGGWHKEVNQMWVDNCVNFRTSAPSGCGRGYLTDGGPNANAPVPGPALRIRPQYEGPHKVAAQALLAELCPDESRTYAKPEDAAYCAPGTGL